MSNENENDKQSELSTEALEKAINPEDKVVKKIDSEHILINKEKYKIINNYREGLDTELLEERYSDFLEKYDYLVGDMSYGKLRLRGFYRDEVKKIPIDMRISYLEDYLLEYCSFGCAYFVLENIELNRKQTNHHYDSNNKAQSTSKPSRPSKPSKPSRPSRPSKSSKPTEPSKPSKPSKPYKKKSAAQTPDKKESSSHSANEKRSFTKTHRSKTNEVGQKKEDVQEVKNNTGKTRFQIRKKKE